MTSIDWMILADHFLQLLSRAGTVFQVFAQAGIAFVTLRRLLRKQTAQCHTAADQSQHPRSKY